MSEHDREHAHAPDITPTTTAIGDAEPGRASRSALLRRIDRAQASGLVGREARDANGVAPHAEEAVAAAGGGAGAALPSALMRKFEDALGADLSGVRVHTGGASAAANDAVGAKAYTVGNDIHFGDGHFDPSSPAGEHLLAHEVAHTVQQAGGTSRVQFKLDVSSPGDGHELEADRAADAMIAGKPVEGLTYGTGVTRLARKPDEHYDPSGQEVVGVGDDTSPREIDWRAGSSPVPVDLGTVAPSIAAPALTYDPARAAAHPDAVKALDAVALEAHDQYTTLAEVVKAFREASAKAEQASSGVATASKDPLAALDNVHQEGAEKAVGQAFKNDQLDIIDANEGSLDALKTTGKAEIANLKDQTATAAQTVADREGDIRTALDNLAIAADDIHVAQNNQKIAANNVDKADKNAQKLEAQTQKGDTVEKLEALKRLIGVGKSIAAFGDKKGSKVEKGVEAIEGVLEIGVAADSAKYDRIIGDLDASISSLEGENASLSKENADLGYHSAVLKAKGKVQDMRDAVTNYRNAVNARVALYRTLSSKVEAAMIANGVPAADAKKAQTGIQAIPLIEDTLAQLKTISTIATPPAYTSASGEGASMCTNLGSLLAIVGLIKGYHQAADGAHLDWAKRLASVNALLAAAK